MPSLSVKVVNYSNPGDCVPRHLPPSQLFPDLDTCGPFVFPGDGSNICNMSLH